MNIVLGVIIGIFVLMALIVAHEFGHFIAARRNGVTVKEFGICFPPRAIAWVRKNGKWKRLDKKDWENEKITKVVTSESDKKTHKSKQIIQEGMILSLNWLPIGGFCQMDGESDADTKKGTFGASSFWQKTKILFAGVGMNWLVAFVILTILAFTGMPQFLENQFYLGIDSQIASQPVPVSSVIEDSPADKAGIVAGDSIESIDGNTVTTGSEVINYNKQHEGETLEYTIIHNDNTKETKSVTLNSSDAEYLLGASISSSQTYIRSTWSAPIVGAVTTVQLTGATFQGLGQLLWNLCSGIASQISFNDDTREKGREAIGAAGDSVSGPVGIVGVIFPAFTQSGPTNVAFLAALISVSLACMNVVPIPALDGGRWLLIAIFKLCKKKLTKETEEKIVSRAFVVLLGLIVLITILDITRFF